MSVGRPFLTVVSGALVAAGGRSYEVTHLLDTQNVLARDLETLEARRLRIDALRPAPVERTKADGGSAASRAGTAVRAGAPDPEAHDGEGWEVAQRRFAAIRHLLDDPFRTRAEVAAAAAAAGVSTVTAYDWINRYQAAGRLSALIPRKRGRAAGRRELAPEAEAVVAAAIEDTFLTRQKRRPQDVVEEVAARCRAAGIKAPHANTVRGRLRDLAPDVVLRRRGRRDEARARHEPLRGSFPGADFPLACVQIDHSEADVVVVGERTRQAMGRPWITLAIDVFSRMVVGLHVSMDRPSAAAAGRCLWRAMVPKGGYLSELGVPGSWPAYGRMAKVHCDNAKEFHGAMLERACREHRIDLEMRPVETPHYGGHIERLIGTTAGEIRKLPGATFSSPAERRGYDSDANAALTLREFECQLVDFIANVYHRRVHSSLGTTPVKRWELGVMGDGERPGTGLPELPADPERLRYDFMPFVLRTVQRYGIAIDGVHYYDEALNAWINAPDPDDPKRKRRFVVRRDPEDISRVYFFDPRAGEHVPIGYRDRRRPAISLWEWRAAQRQVKAEGKDPGDEDTVFEAAERMRRRSEESVAKSKAARRHLHRVDRLAARGAAGAVDAGAGRPPPPARAARSDGDGAPDGPADGDDPFASPVEPFDVVFESD